MMENLNCLDEAMSVHRGTMQKTDMFTKYKTQFIEHFAENDEQEKTRQSVALTIN